jgi:predicted nucleic acid-binding protein
LNPADVPPGPLCVDTNVFSWLVFQRSRHADFARLIVGRLLVLSFATVGELRAGAINAGWGHRRTQPLERAIALCIILLPTDPVTHQFAQVYARFQTS